jgi:hypothetical protein
MTPGIILLIVLILAIIIVCNTPTDHIINLISGLLAIITAGLMILMIVIPVGQVKYQETTPKHLFQNTTCVVAVLDENDTIISTEAEIVNSKLQDIIIYKKIKHNGYNIPLISISTYVFTLKGE